MTDRANAAADRRRLEAEVSHWTTAVAALADLDTVASPAAWQALEQYLHRRLRGRLDEMVGSLSAEATALARQLAAEADTHTVRAGLLRLRQRYLAVETLLDFYGDAVNSRTNPGLGALLRGFDTIAVDSMAATLAQVGQETPPVLVYLDKGLGAAILRAKIRLWDQAHPSPAAAIKLTRHNLSFPTALLHETGHQVCALTGFNDEFQATLHEGLGETSPQLATLWASWASELAGDVHAFLHAGAAPVFALANVVDGSTAQVMRIRHGDPHPFAWIRVMLNVRLCRAWFGPGPWDDLESAWGARHRPDPATEGGLVAAASLPLLDTVVDIATRRGMRCFGGRSFADLLDPGRVSPAGLQQLVEDAGDSLLTSTYLRRREAVRILATLTGRIAATGDPEARTALLDWVRALGHEAAPTARIA